MLKQDIMIEKYFFKYRFYFKLVYVQSTVLKSFQRFPLLICVNKQFELHQKFQNRSKSNNNNTKHLFLDNFENSDLIVWICKLENYEF